MITDVADDTIPQSSASDNTAPASKPSVLLATAKILVVDDTNPLRVIVAKTLKSSGAQVEEARNGREALEMLLKAKSENQPFMLVMLDLMMPVMNGLDTLKQIRANDNFHGLPVVIMSAKAERALVSGCIELGISGYLLKPLSIPKIVEIAVKALATPSNDAGETHTSSSGGTGSPGQAGTFSWSVDELRGQDTARLRMRGEITLECRQEFKKALDMLFGLAAKNLVIDLKDVVRLPSLYIGTLIDAGRRAKEANKEFSVRMNERLGTICRRAGLDATVKILEADG